MTSFFPFFLFFCSFLQGLAHLTLNSQGMGLFCFYCSFFFLSGEQKTPPLLPERSLPSSSIRIRPFLPTVLFSFLHTLPSPSIPFLSFHVPPLHLVDFALSVTLLSCTLAFLPEDTPLTGALPTKGNAVFFV